MQTDNTKARGGSSGTLLRIAEDNIPVWRRIQPLYTINWQTGCWNWNTPASNGYGYTRHNGARVRAHRLTYALTYGEVPAGLQVCHSCDNPRCVNPTHLFLGTQSENTKDAVAKGRQKYPARKGEACSWAKLTADAVKKIRGFCAFGVPQHTIAAQFGISQQQVSKINNGQRWASV